jgi:hypothetical protein
VLSCLFIVLPSTIVLLASRLLLVFDAVTT